MVQLGDLEAAAPPPGQRTSRPGWPERHRSLLRFLVGSAAVIFLLVTLPSLPAAWQGLANLNSLGDDGSGNVVVQQCNRGDLLVDWSCRGTWSANDPMTNPVGPKNVTVVNNARHLGSGTELGFVYVKPGTHEGFNAGTTVRVKTIALWLGVLCVFTALVLLVVTRRNRALWPSLGVLILAVVLIGSAWDLVA